MQPIYLDNNSTTQIDPAVVEAMADCRNEGFLNPASQHQYGQRARRRLEQVRNRLLDLLGGETSGMNADQLLFTSGGTESNNLAVIGLALEPDGSLPENKRVLISGIEHPSVIGAGEYLSGRGFRVEHVSVTSIGTIDLADLRRRLVEPARLVSVMLANNETGVLQPIPVIADLCHSAGAMLHADAVQAVAKIEVSFRDLAADAMTFTGHKFHGPRSIGGLVLRHGMTPFPGMYGGFQQGGLRPGTEDVCLATGCLAALELFHSEPTTRQQHMSRLRDRLETAICREVPGAVINGAGTPRVPHTTNISFPGVNRQEFLMAADVAGVAVSTGSACASGSSEPSPVLLAMGLDPAIVKGSIRISLSAMTTTEEIEMAIERIIRIGKDLGHSKF